MNFEKLLILYRVRCTQIKAFGELHQTRVVYVYQDKIEFCEEGIKIKFIYL